MQQCFTFLLMFYLFYQFMQPRFKRVSYFSHIECLGKWKEKVQSLFSMSGSFCIKSKRNTHIQLTGLICYSVFKRRKRHRRKHFENQEPCIMRGVYYKNMKWQAAIKVDKKQIHLGTVSSQEEAARLYDR